MSSAQTARFWGQPQCHSAELCKPLRPKTVPGEDDPDSERINNIYPAPNAWILFSGSIYSAQTAFRYSQTHTRHGSQFFKFEAYCTYTLHFCFSVTREFTSLTSLGSIWRCQTKEGPAQDCNGCVAFLRALMIWNNLVTSLAVTMRMQLYLESVKPPPQNKIQKKKKCAHVARENKWLWQSET